MFMKLLPYLIVAVIATLACVYTIIDTCVYFKKVELLDQLHEAINRHHNNTQGD